MQGVTRAGYPAERVALEDRAPGIQRDGRRDLQGATRAGADLPERFQSVQGPA